jgi:hypothetical protein
MSKVPSFTFAGGILSKSLWGRYDLNKYQTGLKKAENCIISIEGGVFKRFGTYFTGKRKNQNDAFIAKLIPWRIADDDSYMLEFGHHYIRFIRLGGYVTIPPGHVTDPDSIATNVGGFMEVPTPWTANASWELKYTFANDIMYITHGSNPPQQLQRLGLYDWNLIQQDFDPHPDWAGTVTAVYHDDTTPDDNYDADPIPTHYKVSATLSDGTETKPSPAVTVDADLGSAHRTRVELNWPDYPDAIQYTIYKGANGIYGFIGYSDTSDYIDRNFAPSYEVVPIGDKIPITGGYSRVIEFYKQRMAYAGTYDRPQDIWISRPFIFNSLTKSIPLQDDDAFVLPLVGRSRHTINHMIMLKKFLIFTDSAEWTMETVEQGALTAASADPTIQTYYGAAPYLRPISIGTRILFVQNKTQSVLDLGYEFTSDNFKADNLSKLVKDVFKKKTIVAWDYAVHPLNILLCVFDDGTLGIMTYVREDEIWGWTTSSTQGKFLDVACVTEINQEGIYFQVERVINGHVVRYIERMEINFNYRIEDMVFSDCAITFTDIRPSVLSENSETSMIIQSTGTGFFVGQELRIEVSEDEYYMAEITAVNSGTILTLKPINETKIFSPSLPFFDVYVMSSSFSGIDHLEGERVWVLADAKVYKNIRIESGGFTLPINAARVHIGLPYSAQIETLDLDIDQAKGKFQDKTINEIILNIKNSRGVYVNIPDSEYGPAELLPRSSGTSMYSPNEPLDGPYPLRPHVTWDKTCELIITSDDPLPLNILNICPDITYGR